MIYPFVDINRWSKMTKLLMAFLHSCLEICSVLPYVHGEQNNLDTNMLSGLLET